MVPSTPPAEPGPGQLHGVLACTAKLCAVSYPHECHNRFPTSPSNFCVHTLCPPIPENSACSVSSEKTSMPKVFPAWPKSGPMEICRGSCQDKSYKSPSLTSNHQATKTTMLQRTREQPEPLAPVNNEPVPAGTSGRRSRRS